MMWVKILVVMAVPPRIVELGVLASNIVDDDGNRLNGNFAIRDEDSNSKESNFLHKLTSEKIPTASEESVDFLPEIISEGVDGLTHLEDDMGSFFSEQGDVGRSVKELFKEELPGQKLPEHITSTGADWLWAKGHKGGKGGKGGEPIVLGIASTGVNPDHEALKPNYLGTNPDGSYDHTNSWLDPPGGGKIPFDTRYIGTHLTSIQVGAKGPSGGPPVGMAPEAKFIACRSMDLTSGTPESHLACVEWFNETTPDIVTLSNCETCDDGFFLKDAIDQLIQKGVVVVASPGIPTSVNTCASIVTPPSNYDNVITVAHLENYSSKINERAASGPAIIDGVWQREYVKPDLAAPGTEVRGAVFLDNTNEYLPATDSAVAASVVAGGIALLMDAFPCLRGNPAMVSDLLKKSAEKQVDGRCTPVPVDEEDIAPLSYIYGNGNLDLVRAYRLMKNNGGCSWSSCISPRNECERRGSRNEKKYKICTQRGIQKPKEECYNMNQMQRWSTADSNKKVMFMSCGVCDQ